MSPSAISWDDSFGKLVAYKAKTGSLQVASKHKFLNRWVITQRRKFKEDRLSIERIKKLEGVGFDFSRQSYVRHDQKHNWDDNFKALIAYEAKTGNFHVSSHHSKALQKWVKFQRHKFKDGSLSIDRIRKLEAIGFDFMPRHERIWDDRFAELVAHKAKTGSCNVSSQHSKVLLNWVYAQRKICKEGRLSRDRVEKLQGIGFDFSPQSTTPHLEHSWDDRFAELVAYQEKTGSCNVSSQHSKVLQNWVYTQRKLCKEGTLSIDRMKKLEGIGFDFSPQSKVPYHLEHIWDNRFAELVAYKTKTGTCNVSSQHSKVLQNWVYAQRNLCKEGTLSTDRIKKLEEIGFDFMPQLERNQQLYLGLLRDFHTEFGHLCVPFEYKINNDERVVRLGFWVSKMRQKLKHGMIDEDLKQQLDSLGFVWNPGTTPWKEYPPPPRQNSNQEHGSSQIRADDNLNNGGSNIVASLVSVNCAPAAAATTTTIDSPPPRPMQKIFWRPPTPYPMSDDEEGCLGS